MKSVYHWLAILLLAFTLHTICSTIPHYPFAREPARTKLRKAVKFVLRSNSIHLEDRCSPNSVLTTAWDRSKKFQFEAPLIKRLITRLCYTEKKIHWRLWRRCPKRTSFPTRSRYAFSRKSANNFSVVPETSIFLFVRVRICMRKFLSARRFATCLPGANTERGNGDRAARGNDVRCKAGRRGGQARSGTAPGQAQGRQQRDRAESESYGRRDCAIDPRRRGTLVRQRPSGVFTFGCSMCCFPSSYDQNFPS